MRDAVGTPSRKYMNPYLAGFGLGSTLLAAYAFLGHGLGASGAVTSLVANGVAAAAPGHAADNSMFSAYLGGSRHPLLDWQIFEILGLLCGAFFSARLAGRTRFVLTRGPRAVWRDRVALALVGGAAMGFAARLARGCTSGQALSGGALLSVGAWIFMLAMFAGGFAAARMLRRQWK